MGSASARSTSTSCLLVPIRDQLRRLETLGRPIAAALTGSALGGGFEIALACHHRVGLDDANIVWALAETAMGLIPGGGGLIRMTRMAGVAATVRDIVGPGTVYRPRAALKAGIVDALAPTRESVLNAARDWVSAQDTTAAFVQRWERPGYRIPGGTLPLDALHEEIRQRTVGTPLLAPAAVFDVAMRSIAVDVDTAFLIETEAFLTLLHQPVTALMSRTFFDLKAIADGASRPGGPSITDGTARPGKDEGTTLHVFPRTGTPSLADVFFTPDAPLIEIACTAHTSAAAIAHAYDRVTARGGIPIVSRGGSIPFIQSLMDARRDVASIAAAARRALDDGQLISPADGNVASILATDFPTWTGGVMQYLSCSA